MDDELSLSVAERRRFWLIYLAGPSLMLLGHSLGWITSRPWNLIVTGAGVSIMMVQFVRWMLFAAKGIEVVCGPVATAVDANGKRRVGNRATVPLALSSGISVITSLVLGYGTFEPKALAVAAMVLAVVLFFATAATVVARTAAGGSGR